jgi:hypothetical protein
MKVAAPLLLLASLVMACFTDPKGTNGIWVSSSQVVSVVHAESCAPGANTKINTSYGALCVKETPKEVLKRLEAVSP